MFKLHSQCDEIQNPGQPSSYDTAFIGVVVNENFESRREVLAFEFSLRFTYLNE